MCRRARPLLKQWSVVKRLAIAALIVAPSSFASSIRAARCTCVCVCVRACACACSARVCVQRARGFAHHEARRFEVGGHVGEQCERRFTIRQPPMPTAPAKLMRSRSARQWALVGVAAQPGNHAAWDIVGARGNVPCCAVRRLASAALELRVLERHQRLSKLGAHVGMLDCQVKAAAPAGAHYAAMRYAYSIVLYSTDTGTL